MQGSSNEGQQDRESPRGKNVSERVSEKTSENIQLKRFCLWLSRHYQCTYQRFSRFSETLSEEDFLWAILGPVAPHSLPLCPLHVLLGTNSYPDLLFFALGGRFGYLLLFLLFGGGGPGKRGGGSEGRALLRIQGGGRSLSEEVGVVQGVCVCVCVREGVGLIFFRGPKCPQVNAFRQQTRKTIKDTRTSLGKKVKHNSKIP